MDCKSSRANVEATETDMTLIVTKIGRLRSYYKRERGRSTNFMMHLRRLGARRRLL
jgi:hypothetical protein